MTTYGVRNAYGTLKRVLMHRPGPELDFVTDKTLDEFHFARPVDRERFVADYDAMLDRFRAHGVEVLLVADVLASDADAICYMARRPNMTYTRDLAVVLPTGAVLMGPWQKGRQGDQEMLARAFKRLGVPILAAIEAPGYLEGGGVTMIGDDTVVASLCDRATPPGLRTLRDAAFAAGSRYFLEVPLPRGHIHIDGIFMVLDERLCLVCEDSLSTFPCRLYERGRTDFRHVMFLEHLDARGFTRIPITYDERRAGHLNVVVTERARRAVGFESAVRVREAMARHGWTLDTFPAEELFVGKGGAHCMTCPVLVV
ncbi:MAG: dimethylarginine dimethylaminohydrolase family protein [Vicinamibacterales bacterium]